MIYEIAQVQVAEQGLPTKAIGRWFPYVASLMLFIWVDQHARLHPAAALGRDGRIGGVELPTLAIFAATSTLSVTLALALMTFVFTHVEGIRANGAVSYFKSWIPEVPKALLPMIIPLEILGQFMRLISLSVRLYANMLAGHLLILTFIGLIFLTHWAVFPLSMRRRDRLLPLRGRDRRLDPGVHLRRPVSHLHRLGDRAGALDHSKRRSLTMLSSLFIAAAEDGADAGKAIALALGIGLGALGAGVGLGNIFGSMIQAVARQPELRGELTGIQWLGFALVEAVVFYGLIGGLLAFVLI